MKNIIRDFVKSESRFKGEMRRQIRMLIIVTLGFTIAFTWRQTVFDLSEDLVSLITHVQGTNSLAVLTSTFITILSLAVIYVSAHFLKDDF